MFKSKKTGKIKVGSTYLGGDAPILIQSMCSTKTTDVESTVLMINALVKAGAGLIRLAVDNSSDALALAEIRQRVNANLSVDLQENFRLASKVAPYVDKIRYNPGHLYHLEPNLSWQQKVDYLAETAEKNDCALRIGVNCGSIDPNQSNSDELSPMFASALEHADYLESIGFTRFCVSIKDSDPLRVIEENRRFARLRPHIPLHLGVTEAGLPPLGIIKSRMALETLLAEGIGDTIRVSLTVVNDLKTEEVFAAQEILKNVALGTIIDTRRVALPKLNIVSCPSCSRSNNEAFVDLAQRVREAVEFAKDFPLTIAVMGCRVNGPGETDDADLGLWCGPEKVNLKKGTEKIGSFDYETIIKKVVELVKELISEKTRKS